MQVENKDAFRIARVYQEFSWLGRYAHQKSVEQAKVSRLEQQLINSSPNRGAGERLFLVNRDGGLVTEVGIRWPWIIRFLGFFIWACSQGAFEFNFRREETLAETLIRLGHIKANMVCYAILIRTNRTDRWDRYAAEEVIVLKLPKAFPTLNEWIAEQQRIADNAVKQQIAAADAVPA